MSRSVMGALPARAHTTKGKREDTGGFVQGLVWGLGMSVAGSVIFLFLCAMIANAGNDPDALIAPLGFSAIVMCCLLGGLGVGLKCQNAVLPCALLLGCVLLGLGLAVGLLFGSEVRQALTLELGLGASLGVRAGFVAVLCAAAALTSQIKSKLQARPKRRH